MTRLIKKVDPVKLTKCDKCDSLRFAVPGSVCFLCGGKMRKLQTLEWIPINPPRPIDEKVYDIMLNDGKVVCKVEYWSGGGGFGPLKKEYDIRTKYSSRFIEYDLKNVKAYRESK